jgi:hypothetical protein
VIISHEGPHYKIKNVADQKISTVHVSRLEEFQIDRSRVDPMAVAAKDIREFVVESVLDHKPRHHPLRNKPTLEFLIKWKDFDESYNSWVPWHNLTNNHVCLRYCLATHGMKSLVSKKYREELERADEEDSDGGDD